jgi:Tol biopolymer transport system component
MEIRAKITKTLIFIFLTIIVLVSGCTEREAIEPPTPIPKRILVNQIPEDADIIFNSIRYVLDDLACLDDDYNLKDNFITDPDCNQKIYTPDGGLASPRQLFTLDLETGNVVQVTNTDHFFITGQIINATTILALAAASDTDDSGVINEQDKTELYLIDLTSENITCLTCDSKLNAINNPDYSPVTERIVFSAQKNDKFHNYLFTLNLQGSLTQITNDDSFMDFDCSWSEDGAKIVFNRLPLPMLTKPSQVWLMNADGTKLVRITDGGPNPNHEGNHGPYPIGTDADPDLSPDNSQIVFSRLLTSQGNEPIGIWSLLIIDIETKEVEVLDSRYANMIPEWKSGGIIFIRQQSVTDYVSRPMEVKQSLYFYNGEGLMELEAYPYNVFPLGAFGGSWIE